MREDDLRKITKTQRKNNLCALAVAHDTIPSLMSDPIATLGKLYTAVVADVLDGLGHRSQTLGADIAALTPASKVCGRVFTARAVAVDEIPEEPYKLEMAAIDTMQAGNVVVVDSGHNHQCAFWG